MLSRHEIRPDLGGLQPTGRRSWLAPAFWELLEAEGIATATVNWPATAAADRWPGIHVDETFAVPSGAGFADWPLPTHGLSPSSLRDELAELRVHPADPLQSEVAALAPRIGEAAAAKDKRLLELVTIVAVNATVHSAATHIAAKAEWDVLSVCYDLPHMVKLAFGQPDPVFGGVIERAHVLLDMMIGRLIELRAGRRGDGGLAERRPAAPDRRPTRPTARDPDSDGTGLCAGFALVGRGRSRHRAHNSRPLRASLADGWASVAKAGSGCPPCAPLATP